MDMQAKKVNITEGQFMYEYFGWKNFFISMHQI